MKTKFYILAVSIFISIAGKGQFSPVNINFPNPNNAHYPEYISILDAQNVWLGTLSYDNVGYFPCSVAVHTNDGGNSWVLDSIPVSGFPIVSSLFAVDANTCFYVYTDNGSGGSIWKTSDGGANWENKTTNQFTEPGGFANFYCAFDEDEGIALGDPTLGYFEIQLTADGGDTWTRVAESSIPPVLPGEWGGTNAFSVVGDNVWFATGIADGNGTYSTRCFKSADRGHHWTVSPIVADNLSWYTIVFSTAEKGIIYDPNMNDLSKKFYYTSDGGSTWSTDSTTFTEPAWMGMSAVPGFDGGFVMATNDTSFYSTKVLFTPDFFNTVVVIDSNLQSVPYGIKFKDEMTGWLEGNGSDTIAMLKYSGLLTSVSEAVKTSGKLAILPNPTSMEALVKLPGLSKEGGQRLMIYDMAGNLLEKRQIESTTGWTKLNASAYSNGVYVVLVVSGDRVIAGTKWVVKH